MSDKATIKIQRPGYSSARFIVVLDGQTIGTTANTKIESFALEQGHHSIFIKGTFGRKTEKIDFYIGPGETKSFKCGIQLIYNLALALLLIYFVIDSFALHGHDIRNYVRIGVYSLAILFAIAGFLKPGLCYYIKEVQDPQISKNRGERI